jgi:hypothetical protein
MLDGKMLFSDPSFVLLVSTYVLFMNRIRNYGHAIINFELCVYLIKLKFNIPVVSICLLPIIC